MVGIKQGKMIIKQKKIFFISQFGLIFFSLFQCHPLVARTAERKKKYMYTQQRKVN